jgi:CDP-6-deoxy-D-xylo-4-hexulose-3-dehydrase
MDNKSIYSCIRNCVHYFVESNINIRIRNSEIKKSNALTEEDYKLLPNTDFIMNNSFWLEIYPAINAKPFDKMSS